MQTEQDENLDAMHRVICGSNLEVLPRFLRNSVDLCLTSPPYANQRKKHYNSISESDYPEWTLQWMTAVERVLKPHGSIMLVIRSHIKHGAVSPYVLKTRLLLQEHGWHEPQELIWHKPDGVPVGRRDRCRQTHEQILWFSKTPNAVYCDPKAGGTPSTRIAELRGGQGDLNGKGLRNGVDAVKGRKSRTAYAGDGTGEGKASSRGVPAGAVARVTDLVRVAVSTCNSAEYNNHPAQHPAGLYRFLIQLASPPDGVILDPFAGSGTTCEAAFAEGRSSISIEKELAYVEIIRKRHWDLAHATA